MKKNIKLWIVLTIVAIMTVQSYHVQAQNKFNFGISVPTYFGTARFGDVLQYANERQGHTGKDALKFEAGTGFGLFGELEFNEEWTFDIYWQKYANKTNFGKNNADAFTPSANGSETSQYKMSHGIIGVGASRKAFQIKGYDVWIFSALSGGSRKFAWRPEGGDFSNERNTTNRLFIGQTEAPIYFNFGLSPKFSFADKFFFSPKIGYEMELMRGDGGAFHGGLVELVQPSYGAVNDNTTQTYPELEDKTLNRFFIELRVGMKLGK